MASQTLPVPLRQARKRVQVKASVRAPSIRTTLIVFVALLILFRWLHLILALQIAATGRQIQILTEELNRTQREQALTEQAIAEATLPSRMLAEAARLGYGPRDPLYLVSEPRAVEPASGQGPDGSEAGGNTEAGETGGVLGSLNEILGSSTASQAQP